MWESSIDAGLPGRRWALQSLLQLHKHTAAGCRNPGGLYFDKKECGLWFNVVGDRIPMRTGALHACELLDLSARMGFPRAVPAATWLETGPAGAQP